MIEKARLFLTILLVIILIVGIVFSGIKIVISWFEKPFLLTSDNMTQYMKEENVVTNHSTYYYMKDCLNNFIEACNQQKYNELYNLYIEDYAKQYTEEEVLAKLKKLQWKTEEMDETIEYKLEKVYTLDRQTYILDITLEGESLYLIFRTNTIKGYDYGWAFVK